MTLKSTHDNNLESTPDRTQRRCWSAPIMSLLKVKYNKEFLADMLEMAREHGFMDEVFPPFSCFFFFVCCDMRDRVRALLTKKCSRCWSWKTGVASIYSTLLHSTPSLGVSGQKTKFSILPSNPNLIELLSKSFSFFFSSVTLRVPPLMC